MKFINFVFIKPVIEMYNKLFVFASIGFYQPGGMIRPSQRRSSDWMSDPSYCNHPGNHFYHD